MNLNSDLLLNLLFGVTSFSIILSIYLVLSSFLREKRVKEILNSNSLDLSSQYEETSHILEAEKKSNTIIHKALRQAQKILVKAELSGLSLIAREKLESKRLASEYQLELRKVMEEIKLQLQKTSNDAEKSYISFLKEIEDRVGRDLTKKQEVLEVKIDSFFEKTQTLLTEFVDDLHDQTQTQLDKEIGNAKKIIEEYRVQRLQIVDENIVAILEKTLNITLGKKLTLSEQTELIYEALEEAKKENFFV